MKRVLLVLHGTCTHFIPPVRDYTLDVQTYSYDANDPWRGLERAGVYKQEKELREGFWYDRVVALGVPSSLRIYDALVNTPCPKDHILCARAGGSNPAYRIFQWCSPDEFACDSRAFNRMAEFRRSYRFEMPEVKTYPAEYRFFGHIKSMSYTISVLRYEQ